jgi:cobalt-zinc-cadmium efflux system outer membrane protein
MVSYLPPSLRRELRRSIRSATLSSLLLTGASAAFAESRLLTLEVVRRTAVAEAPRVAAQRSRIAAAREDAVRAAALPDPTLSVGIDNLTVTGADAFQLGADDMTMRRIGLTQDWPSQRKREARRAVADAQIDTVLSETDATALDVERLAGGAWLDTWAAEAEQHVVDELRDEAERAVDIAEGQLANGTGTAADAMGAKMALAELDAEWRRSEAQVHAARAGLSRWIDLTDITALAPLPDFGLLRDPPQHLRATLDQHAHLLVWEGRERAADTAVDLARAEKRPDLGFGVSYGARSAGLPDMMMLEVTVGLPLFGRNRQDRDIAGRLAERDAVVAGREEARREMREALERQLALWEGLRDEREHYASTLLPLARDRSAVALAAYGSSGEIQPWIAARRDEIAARRRYVQLQAELGRAWLELDTLLPRGTAATERQP